MEKTYIVDVKRTAFGSDRDGFFESKTPKELATGLIRKIKKEHILLFKKRKVDEIILGCVNPSPTENNTAQLVAMDFSKEFDYDTPGKMTHKSCLSSLDALTEAVIKIQAGYGGLYIVGGVESSSTIGNDTLKEIAYCSYDNVFMTEIAKEIAEDSNINIKEQNEYVDNSWKKAVNSKEFYANQIVEILGVSKDQFDDESVVGMVNRMRLISYRKGKIVEGTEPKNNTNIIQYV